MDCIFCSIVAGNASSKVVFSDQVSLGFLDRRPIFPGHTLLIPKEHYETLEDLPSALVGPYFSNAKLLSIAVRKAVEAEGTFVGINNKISQSVQHLHIHIVPRRSKDGLRGFFWPRQKYGGEEEEIRIQEAIKREVSSLGCNIR